MAISGIGQNYYQNNQTSQNSPEFPDVSNVMPET